MIGNSSPNVDSMDSHSASTQWQSEHHLNMPPSSKCHSPPHTTELSKDCQALMSGSLSDDQQLDCCSTDSPSGELHL